MQITELHVKYSLVIFRELGEVVRALKPSTVEQLDVEAGPQVVKTLCSLAEFTSKVV